MKRKQSQGLVGATAALVAAGFLIVAGPPAASEGSALRVKAGLKEAGVALAGRKPFVDIVCPIMQQQAEIRGLPPMPFVRLIWKESRFDPRAVSPKGAQGIAQFMPGTAEERGLDNPFEPKSAIVHSASLLSDLGREFGNFGLAAAAYNAGAERVRSWLSGSSHLPWETQNYVRFITGRAAAEWKLEDTALPQQLQTAGTDVQVSCRALAPLVVRAVYETEPLTASGAWRPWGVHVSTSFSKAKALDRFARLKRAHAALLGGREPFVLPVRNLSRGRRSMYMVQIGADAREDANALCARLRAEGGACIVQKN